VVKANWVLLTLDIALKVQPEWITELLEARPKLAKGAVKTTQGCEQQKSSRGNWLQSMEVHGIQSNTTGLSNDATMRLQDSPMGKTSSLWGKLHEDLHNERQVSGSLTIEDKRCTLL